MKIERSLDGLKDDYDWVEVFKFEYASPVPFSNASNNAFVIEDVEEIIASVNGENDGADWVMIGKLKDGRFFKINASCDYTGWGCQEWGHSTVALTLDELIRLGVTDDERERLEIQL